MSSESNNPRLDELIQREIDGVNSAAESEALMKLIENSPDARARFSEMVGLAESIREIDSVDPPAELKESIMAAIARRALPATKKSEGLWSRIASAVSRSFTTRPSYAFAAGVSLAALLFVVAISVLEPDHQSDPRQINKIVGTLLMRAAEQKESSGDATRLSAGKGSAEFTTFREDGAVVCLVSSQTAGCEATVTTADHNLRMKAVVNGDSGKSSGIAEVDWQAGAARVRFTAPGSIYVILEVNGALSESKLKVSLTCNGMTETKEIAVE